MADYNPWLRRHTAYNAPVVLGADFVQPVAVARKGKVAEVTYTPAGAMAGSSTCRTLSLINKGQSGSGSTVVATLAFTAGINLVAFDEKAITLTATVADLEVAEGDILAFSSVHTSTGVADPGGLVKVVIQDELA